VVVKRMSWINTASVGFGKIRREVMNTVQPIADHKDKIRITVSILKQAWKTTQKL